MKTYRVTHRESGKTYFLLADSSRRAIEIVTLRFQSPEGIAAWQATEEAPPFKIDDGVLLDEASPRDCRIARCGRRGLPSGKQGQPPSPTTSIKIGIKQNA